jgi:hypothetical protein
MSYTRITSFTSWLANKWCGNLFHLPLKFHNESIKDAHGNVFLHLMSTGVIVILACIFMGKDADGKYTGGLLWDILFYSNILHFVYCIILNQYYRYIAEMNGTLDRLKDQSSHE